MSNLFCLPKSGHSIILLPFVDTENTLTRFSVNAMYSAMIHSNYTLLFANHTYFYCYLIGMVVDNNRSTCFCISLTSVALSEIQDPLKVRHSSGCLAVLTLTKTRFFQELLLTGTRCPTLLVPGRLLMRSVTPCLLIWPSHRAAANFSLP